MTLLSNPSFQIPLLLHLLIEIPASLSFLFNPRSQLPPSSSSPTSAASSSHDRDAILILRNFGGLLLATNLLVSVLLFHQHNFKEDSEGIFDGNLSGWILLSLGTYHFWPCWRAWDRIKRSSANQDKKEQKALGGPKVHLVVHLICLFALLVSGWQRRLLGHMKL
ncbi:hypothetical protein QBC43DRAFT_262092 [Cladorrhinum sp. PSN259]|nr:hypothetical protein QBC43DRAFT_262092 [Cladorrhinum sp. PSN259]